MPTCGQVIDETLALLQSWSLDQSQSTTLTSPILSTDLTFPYDTAANIATGISAGMVEIDRELIYVENVDGTNATVPAWGRGYRSTTAAAHSAGARVISQPTFPRQKTLDGLNQMFERIFPRIFAVRSFETTTTQPIITYDLPDDAQWLLKARWQVPDGRLYWQDVRRWRMSSGGGTQFGDTGITVDVADYMQPGRPIQFLYAAKPTPLVNETDDFVTVTGLNGGLVDVVELGAATQLVTALELSRLQVSSIEQQNRSQLVAPSAALTSSRYLDTRFQERLEEERKALQRLYPPRITREWM